MYKEGIVVSILAGIVIVLEVFMISCIITLMNTNSISPRVKRGFVLSFICLGICQIAEFVTSHAVHWNMNDLSIVLYIGKAIEHSLAPVPLFFIASATSRLGKTYKYITIPAMILNSIVCISSIFTRLTFSYDENNVYHREPMYILFIGIIVALVVYVIIRVYKAAVRFQRPNLPTLASLLVIFLFGFFLHIMNPDIHSTWIGAIIASGLFVLYYMDLVLQRDHVSGLMNRRSYALAVEKLGFPCAYLMMDIDGFKKLNDTMGHQYGDECLRAVGDAIHNAFGKYGTCYRIGGDEFVVILTKKLDKVDSLIEQFNTEIEKVKSLFEPIESVSVGYSIIRNIDEKADKLQEADINMYKIKADKKENITQ